MPLALSTLSGTMSELALDKFIVLEKKKKKKQKLLQGRTIKHCYLRAWKGDVLSGTHLLYSVQRHEQLY